MYVCVCMSMVAHVTVCECVCVFVLVGSCLATKVLISNLQAMGREGHHRVGE